MSAGNGHRIALEDGGTADRIIDLSNPVQQPGADQAVACMYCGLETRPVSEWLAGARCTRCGGTADHPPALPGPGQMPPGHGQNGSGPPPLGEDERAELVRLRGDVLQYQKRLAAKTIWWPGQPLPESAEPLRSLLEADWQAEVETGARASRLARESQRLADAADFRRGTAEEYPGTLADSLKRERPAQRYLIGGLWRAAHNLSIEAMFKTGKTTLACSAAGALADGTPFLGFGEVHQPAGRVGMWNCEMDADDFDDYLAPHVSDTGRVAVAHLRGHPMPLASSAAAREEAVGWLRWQGITVWVIDSWTRLCAWNNTDPIDNYAVGRLTAVIDEIKAEAGVSALAVTSHMPHAARTDRAFERGLGAQAFSGWVDAMWRYTRDDNDSRFMSADGRKVSLEECQVFMDSTGRLRAFQGDRDSSAEQTMEYTLLAAITMRPGMSTAQICKAAGKRKENAEAVLHDLAARGRLWMKTGPRNAHLWYAYNPLPGG